MRRSSRLLLCAIVLFLACASPPLVNQSHGWDSRDPEVIYTEGTIEGIRDYTYANFRRWREIFKEWAKGKDPIFLIQLNLYEMYLNLLDVQLGRLERHPEKGKTMVGSHTEVKNLKILVADTTDSLFGMMKVMRQTEK